MCRLLGSDQAQARFRCLTLSGVMFASGLKALASYVLRHINQSDAGGSTSIASETGVNELSGLGRGSGGGGI